MTALTMISSRNCFLHISCDTKGISRGYAFAAFSNKEKASEAISEMNKKMIGSKPLYVAFAGRKEYRAARLYPLVEQLEPESAAKVTGKFLQMDQSKVLCLMELPQAFRAKVAEAMQEDRSLDEQLAVVGIR